MVVPGKQIFSALNKELETKLSVFITSAQIIDSLWPDEVPVDLIYILRDLNVFAGKRPGSL